MERQRLRVALNMRKTSTVRILERLTGAAKWENHTASDDGHGRRTHMAEVITQPAELLVLLVTTRVRAWMELALRLLRLRCGQRPRLL